MEIVEIGMAIYGVGALIIAIAVIAWPLESERGELRRILRARRQR